MAHKLDIPVTTVQGWKKRGAIPLARHADLRAAAARHKITLDEADLEAATPSEDKPAADTTPAGVTVVDAPVVESIDPVTSAPVPADPAAGEPVAAAPAEPPAAEAKPEDAKPEDAKPDAGKPAETVETTAGPEPYAAATAAPEPAEPRRAETIRDVPPPYVDEPRSGSGFATALSLVALLVGAAALSEPWWGPKVPGWPGRDAAVSVPAAAPAADPALRSQLQQLADRVGKLEQRPAANGAAGGAAGGAAPVDTAAIDGALRQLAGRIDALEKRPAPAAAGNATAAAQPDPRVDELNTRLAGLEQRLGAVASTSQAAQDLRKDLDAVRQQLTGVSSAVESQRNAATSAQALVLAAGQLRSALAAGQPFQQELQAVRGLGVADPSITQPLDALAPYAAKGVPTQPQLTDRFKPLASEIVRAANRGEGNDWVEQVTGKLATLITVRRQGGGVVGNGPEAIVARAEAAVDENNLPRAVEELSALQGPAAETAAPWVADAKARLAANQAGQQLTTKAIALLSAASGAKGAGQ
ncbi:hypothetical protein DEW08_17265 [Azospirillum thermophilum]|uniref:Inner membrane protein n=2 Tax=Azospirillum thermophilum TaxID=2202148 RepID=A0A2S2CT96_9PROT|nr:hypothetical protein DEW08_17265 [Azospirillum thermophilum]